VNKSVTPALLKIFAKGFYREHSGLILFLFVSLLTYCVFTETLNQTHLTPKETKIQQLLFVISLASSPALLMIVGIFWFIVTVKSWSYFYKQILRAQNQFLFYSLTSSRKKDQFFYWLTVHLGISFPMIVYSLFVMIIGAIFSQYQLPLILLFYVLMLSIFSACLCLYQINRTKESNANSAIAKIVVNWPKPFYSLAVYHLFDQQKIALVVTKLLSYACMVAGTHLFLEGENKLQAAAIITLVITVAHTILIYQSYQFECIQLSFYRNFPFSKAKIFSSWLISLSLLILPECIWLVFKMDLVSGILLISLSLGIGMLVRSMLYRTGLDIAKYIQWVFYLFCICFTAILFKAILILAIMVWGAAFLIFEKYYYAQNITIPR
jgi:hypothetical protein